LACGSPSEPGGKLENLTASISAGTVVRPLADPAILGQVTAKNLGPGPVTLLSARLDHVDSGLRVQGFGVLFASKNDTGLGTECGAFPPLKWNATWLKGTVVPPREVFEIVPILVAERASVLRARNVTLTYRSGSRTKKMFFKHAYKVTGDPKAKPCPVDPNDHRR
jgi:hypothetical protein